jgi:hypothetical protein
LHPSPDNKWHLFHTCLMKQNHLVWQACSIKIDEYNTNKSSNYSSFLWRSRHFQCPILEFR